MRVALDTNALYKTQAGVARYIRGLQKGFEQIAAPDVEVFPFAWEVENFGYRQPQRALKTFYCEFIWAKFFAPSLLQKKNAQILHATAGLFVQPPPGTREIATLHDLAVLRFPERFRRWQRYASPRRLQHLIRADRIICISQFAADEAMTLMNLPARKLTVIHNGCEFHPNQIALEEKPAFDVPPEFFLFVGSLEPGKNLALLKEAYTLAETKKHVLPPLLIVGARWEGVGNEGAPPKNWHYLGRQPDEALVYLYHRARALVFPSKYEGFGFPLVEAMALSCPVICSPVASLPEVGGDAACFVPLTPGDYLKAMQRLLQEAGWRDELIAKGRAQAAKFSWKKCAGEVLEMYRSTAA